MRHRARIGIPLALTLALALATTGCSTPTDDHAPKGEPAARTAALDSCGRQFSFDRPPQRAVALDQTSTETLLELGLQDRMAGTANLKTKIPAQYQDAYAKVPVIAPKIATGEQLRATAADFVVAGSTDLYTKDRAGTREELAAFGVPSFVSAVDCPQQNEAGKTPSNCSSPTTNSSARSSAARNGPAGSPRSSAPPSRRPPRTPPGPPPGAVSSPPSSTSTRSSTACPTSPAGPVCPVR